MSNVTPIRSPVFICCEHDEDCERRGVPCSSHPWYSPRPGTSWGPHNDAAVTGGIKRRSAPPRMEPVDPRESRPDAHHHNLRVIAVIMWALAACMFVACSMQAIHSGG